VQNAIMRLDSVVLLGALACFASGCAGGHATATDSFAPVTSGTPSPTKVGPAKPAPLIVTPAPANRGRIILVNTSGRYVVLSCPFGYIPALDRRLNVYRGGLKVAEIKITGPQRDTNTVADILTGDCQVGDETRED
jgi:hypothetical protein